MISARLLDHLELFLAPTEAPRGKGWLEKLKAIEIPIDGLQTPIEIPTLAVGKIATQT